MTQVMSQSNQIFRTTTVTRGYGKSNTPRYSLCGGRQGKDFVVSLWAEYSIITSI